VPSSCQETRRTPSQGEVKAPASLYRKRNKGVIKEVIAILPNLHLRRQPCKRCLRSTAVTMTAARGGNCHFKMRIVFTLFLFLNGVKHHLPNELLYFILYRLVGLDASCPKHTLYLKTNTPLIYYTGLYKNKMVKYASVHDRVRLVSDFLCF
jgi:hypothetical protein